MVLWNSLNMFVTALYKCYLDILLLGNKAFMEINQCFNGPEILNFERSLGLSPRPQNSLVPPCKIFLWDPAYHNWPGLNWQL
jgi:hypothetical protein